MHVLMRDYARSVGDMDGMATTPSWQLPRLLEEETDEARDH